MVSNPLFPIYLRQVLGRIRGSKASMRDTTFQSSAHGKRDNVETTIDGRVVFDMLQYIRRDHKLSSYRCGCQWGFPFAVCSDADV